MTDWQRDLEDARATIEELTRERDEARTSLDALAKVCGKAIVAASLADGEALVDTGDHVIVSTVIRLKKERDEARAEAKRERARASRLQDLLDTPPDTER